MELPQPNPIAAAHSETLRQSIIDDINRRDGWIGFDEFMQQCLYTPGLGYYANTLEKLGESGDFITAPEMGNLLARCVALQCQSVFKNTGHQRILEFGAGSGRFAVDILHALKSHNNLPDEYLILELSQDLADRQRINLSKQCPEMMDRVKWISAFPDAGFRGIIIANEVLDAMPVHRFEIDIDGTAKWLGVSNEEDVLQWSVSDQSLPFELQERIPKSELMPGYRSEIGLQGEAWLRSLGACLESGLILMIDYGFPEKEFYHSDRRDGTLMCHYRHLAHSDPFFCPGLQDVTAHVDFSALARCASESNLDVIGFTTQAAFLLGSGILDMAEANATEKELLELAQQIKKLTMPHEMGELFKVMALSRDVQLDTQAFRFQDHRRRL